MCKISATEFKTNFGKYLELALNEDILITKNGHPLYILSRLKSDSWQNLANKWENVERFPIDENDPKIAHILKNK